jgi:hypothetical protein
MIPPPRAHSTTNPAIAHLQPPSGAPWMDAASLGSVSAGARRRRLAVSSAITRLERWEWRTGPWLAGSALRRVDARSVRSCRGDGSSPVRRARHLPRSLTSYIPRLAGRAAASAMTWRGARGAPKGSILADRLEAELRSQLVNVDPLNPPTQGVSADHACERATDVHTGAPAG